MADTPMTFEEAVDYLDDMIVCGYTMHERPQYASAKAIVDQAVRYVQSCRELETVGDTGSEPIVKRVADEWVKLRALERGEEVQP